MTAASPPARRRWSAPRLDPFILALLATVALASALPPRGAAAPVFDLAADLGIALLFFLHGARLSPRAVLGAAAHWRLHAAVFGFTFVVFPLLGVLVLLLPDAVLSPPLRIGLAFLCCLPSTVQSSIGFTAIARGNVAAALVSASLSNLIGILLTPLLVTLLLHRGGQGQGWESIRGVLQQLLLPFVLGQLARPLIGGWVGRHKQLTSLVDRGSILLVVYTAFGAAVVAGLWRQVSPAQLAVLLALSGLLLAAVLFGTAWTSRRLGFGPADEATVVFCGSKKSLVSGVPMAGVLFPAAQVGLIVLPVMIFHQLQLMVCAWLASRYAAEAEARERAEAGKTAGVRDTASAPG